MRNTRTRRHPIIIVGAGADFEEIGRDIAALSPEHLVPIFAGMITRIREEGDGDAVRGRTRLSGLLGRALDAAAGVHACFVRIGSEDTSKSRKWHYRTSPEKLGAGIIALRYDLTVRVLRSMLESFAHREAGRYRSALKPMLMFVATFVRIERLCTPYIEQEKKGE